jgi:3-hydroxyisobutyrate dehydrogenase-like beta-hydroxyacid dehydrogenase
MRVAVLGLGRMGSAIAERLAGGGHELAVWNRTRSVAERLAGQRLVVLDEPVDAWEHGDVAVVVLADTAAVEAVLDGPGGLLSAAAAGRTIIDMSTISPERSARIGERAKAVGAAFLRAPVTGNPSVVRAGNLGIMISGPRSAYDAVTALLHDIGPNLFYVGEKDEARVVKLAVNLVLAGTTELLAEALVMAERAGIDRSTMLEVIGGSAMGSPFVKYKTDALVADDYSSTFTARGMEKDLRLALETANGAGVPLPVTALVQQLLQGCIASGMGDIDFTALVPRLRREAGLDPETYASS